MALDIDTQAKSSSERVDLWSRQTTCFAKVGSEWKITHAHMSVPMNMDAEHRAEIDLKP